MTTNEPLEMPEAHDAVSERAADFFERRRFGEWSEEDQAELEAWIAQSTFHRVAFLRLAGAVAQTEELAMLRGLSPMRADRPAAAREKRFARLRFPLLAAASIGILAFAGYPYLNSLLQSPDRTYSTEVGGRTLLNFADHTQIELNTDTVVHFRMTSTERTVWLEKGEAWFAVAHNAANPFTVVIGKHRITDLGTEFDVRRGADRVEVALLSGRAALSAEGSPTTLLVPGDDAVATRASVSVTRKSQQELADELAWRHGLLVFRQTRLADVVREFNRYNATKLVIADPSIAGEPITADLKSDDYEAFVNLARTALNLRVDREGREILISRGLRGGMKGAVRSHSRTGAP